MPEGPAGLDPATREALALWPPGLLPAAKFTERWAAIRPAFLDRLEAERIPAGQADALAAIYLPLAAWMQRQRGADTLVLGVNGAQGSGKSTLCAFLALVLEAAYGCRVAGFSIDDLYKTRAERERLARDVHPLFRTRGVPGTHDVELGLATLSALKSARPGDLTPLPAFDKALDDRRPRAEWPEFRGRPDVIVFEGWCVGTRPQPETALAAPVNELERLEDPDGVWRRHVNRELQGEYARLFADLDRLILLQVPDMDCVFLWRSLQEQKLAERTEAAARGRLMDTTGLRRFIMHYERLTRHNLASLPDQADLSLRLDADHRFVGVRVRTP